MSKKTREVRRFTDATYVHTLVIGNGLVVLSKNLVDSHRGFPTELTPQGWLSCIIKFLEEYVVPGNFFTSLLFSDITS